MHWTEYGCRGGQGRHDEEIAAAGWVSGAVIGLGLAAIVVYLAVLLCCPGSSETS